MSAWLARIGKEQTQLPEGNTLRQPCPHVYPDWGRAAGLGENASAMAAEANQMIRWVGASIKCEKRYMAAMSRESLIR
jgi:hypothetical protein